VEIISKQFEEIANEDQDILSTDANFNMLPDEVKMAASNPISRHEDVMAYISNNVRQL
jgi:hypothetical protein